MDGQTMKNSLLKQWTSFRHYTVGGFEVIIWHIRSNPAPPPLSLLFLSPSLCLALLMQCSSSGHPFHPVLHAIIYASYQCAPLFSSSLHSPVQFAARFSNLHYSNHPRNHPMELIELAVQLDKLHFDMNHTLYGIYPPSNPFGCPNLCVGRRH